MSYTMLLSINALNTSKANTFSILGLWRLAEPRYILIAPARLRPEFELGVSRQVLFGIPGEEPERG